MSESNGHHPERTKPRDWYRIAAEYIWEHPGCTDTAIIEHCGIARSTFYSHNRREEFEIMVRDRGNELMPRLAPAAFHGLMKAWAKGNPAGAQEILTKLGFLRPDHLEISVRSWLDLIAKEIPEAAIKE